MNYYIRKTGALAVTLILMSLITFGVFQVLPGNPVDIILGVDADPLQVEAMSKNLHLDKPVVERYLIWAASIFKGDLGNSTRFQRPVSELVKNRIEVTGALAVFSLLLTLLAGIPTGIWLAKRNNKKRSIVVSILSQIGLAIPSFWMGIILIMVFSVALHILPSGGYISWRQDLLSCAKSLILPAVSITAGTTAVLVRYLKSSMLDQFKMDYVRTAYSKGLRVNHIITWHVLRNAFIPVVTILGMITVQILGGSIIIENVFSLPGMGNLITISITSRDLPLIQALVLYLAAIVAVCNFLVDILYTVIDPRIRLK